MSYDYWTGTTITPGQGTIGAIESNDEKDWHRIHLTEGFTYQVDLDGWDNGSDKLLNPHAVVYDETCYEFGVCGPGNPVLFENGLAFTAAMGETYYIKVSSLDPHTGGYRLSVDSYDHVATGDTLGEVIVGASAKSVIETRLDQDWFRVSLLAGQQYQVDLEGVHSVHGALPDAYIRGIYGADGNLVPGTANDDVASGHLNSRVLVTPAASGEYYISAGAYGHNTGSYKLSLHGADDFAADLTTVGRVYPHGPAKKGAIQSVGDHDWFRVSLEADEFYRINLEGADTKEGALEDPYLLGVYDSNGQLLPKTTDDNGGLGRNAYLSFTPEESGDYYIAVGAFGDSTGTYELSAEPDYLLF